MIIRLYYIIIMYRAKYIHKFKFKTNYKKQGGQNLCLIFIIFLIVLYKFLDVLIKGTR